MVKKTIVVAVSGGPDSMCLLDMLRQSRRFAVRVCHVDYHQRDSSKRDCELVKTYCHKYHIPFHLLHVLEKPKGNFQANAREIRYAFFKEVYDKYHASYLAVGHHIDDHLETYCLQKNRKAFLLFGLQTYTKMFGMSIIRPLLAYTKAQIVAYLDMHNINYGLDETNETSLYERNRIRMQLCMMNEQTKRQILKQIEYENCIVNKTINGLKKDINQSLSIETFINLSLVKQKIMIALWFRYLKIDIAVSDTLIKQLIKVSSQNGEKRVALTDHQYIIKTYDTFVYFQETVDSYEYVLEKPESLHLDTLSIDIIDNGGMCLMLSQDQFPITIRNWRKGDQVQFDYGKKKVSRVFIDHKVPKYLRSNWPIICDCRQNIVCIPNIMKIKHKSSDNFKLFVLK